MVIRRGCLPFLAAVLVAFLCRGEAAVSELNVGHYAETCPRSFEAEDMTLDLERGVKEGTDAPAHQVQAMAEDEDQEHLTLDLMRVHQVEGGAVAGETNHGQKKWLPYWLLAAASVIVLTNLVHAAPMDQLFPPELAMFTVLLCAICLMLRAMKQM